MKVSNLRSLVERIERVELEIKAFNEDKRDIYAEAKGLGFDVRAMKAVIARRRKDPEEAQEFDAIVETYLAELERGTDVATRVHAHDEDLGRSSTVEHSDKPVGPTAAGSNPAAPATASAAEPPASVAASPFAGARVEESACTNPMVMDDIPEFLRRSA